MAQVNRSDWVNAALNQLREQGPQAVSGEKLARRLDVTRGSFYHHFPSMDDFIEQVMDEWERTYTRALLEKVHTDDPGTEMNRLLEAAWNADIELELAVRQWGFVNPTVQKRIERMDQVRLMHVSNLYSILIGDDAKGRKFGKIAYFGLLGALHSSPRPTRAELRDMVLEIQTLLLHEL